jgi:NAD(P)H-hydrate epimerase
MMNRFRSETGIDVVAISAAQMREVDRIAIEETGPNLYQMMENAGRNLAELACELRGPRPRVVVLAGRGGNGGGGICAARHLANHGVDVALCLLEPDALGEVPAFQRKVFAGTRGRELPEPPHEPPDVIIDAIFGYSLAGAPRGRSAEWIAWANDTGAPIVALDLPSGVDATSGETPGPAIRATWTMTLALPKTGLCGPNIGELVLADIGIPAEVYVRMGLAYATPFDHRYRVRLRGHED